MKKSYHAIIDPTQNTLRTVRIEREEVAGEAMPELADAAIRAQVCVHERGYGKQRQD